MKAKNISKQIPNKVVKLETPIYSRVPKGDTGSVQQSIHPSMLSSPTGNK